jgi:hypothetical protein
MAAKIVNLVYPDEEDKLCATVEEAEQTLASMVESFKSLGYRVEEKQLPDEDYRQYAVYDHDDTWIGTYTIVV